ncbi:small GTP-binding protein, putative [Trichomonas vaginalis G3]|uniref:Small GTP-binding protein, putative n=1 Tax=Trichomonas vaginalis (strain ATCC PRA-98 / G3) TaxID=412133 RepID=A2FNU5_TRIV3|nr:GTPase protein [Trichomonas vaginalis G3]EAX93426.1 small GTP-binding protein, putative [Trichomonas vaginalis G3]KAI5506165.1 GTPase protein [Trichomonas vaginalis G3]|eukprot:XP_001306356.1 small GTP-binding protein [Trichomonas vaginalis G3]
MQSESEPILGRIVLVGDTQVGKTSIIQKYLRGQCSQEQKSTIGAVFHTQEVVFNNRKVSFQIWDTAGQERYKALGPIYYRKSNAAIAVFDLTRKETLQSLESWIDTFRSNSDDNFVVIAANKSDLESSVCFSVEETSEFASRLGCECIWVSAMTGVGIEELFQAITEHVYSKVVVPSDEHVVDVTKAQVNAEGEQPCC